MRPYCTFFLSTLSDMIMKEEADDQDIVTENEKRIKESFFPFV